MNDKCFAWIYLADISVYAFLLQICSFLKSPGASNIIKGKNQASQLPVASCMVNNFLNVSNRRR